MKQNTVQVAVVQAGAVPFDTGACVDKAVRLIGEAAATGAKVILFPEAFIPGYPKGMHYGLVVGARDPIGREEFRLYLDAAIEVPGPETRRMGEAAEAHGSYVVIGVIEREFGTCYCTVLFFGPDGSLLGKHRKLMPTALELSLIHIFIAEFASRTWKTKPSSFPASVPITAYCFKLSAASSALAARARATSNVWSSFPTCLLYTSRCV